MQGKSETEPYVDCTYFFGCYEFEGNSPRLWTGEMGDVYAELHYTRTYRRYDFLTTLTGDAPTASYRKGLTTGRAQWDWFNHGRYWDTAFETTGPRGLREIMVTRRRWDSARPNTWTS